MRTEIPLQRSADPVRREVEVPALGPLSTIFEFELFGTGVDAGQTTFRHLPCLRRIGPVWSGSDLESVHGHRCLSQLSGVLGPNRRLFSNVQFRWMPLKGDSRITGLGRPAAPIRDGGTGSNSRM